VRNDAGVKIEVAGRSPADPGLALSGEAQHGSLANAAWDLDLDAPAAGKRDPPASAPQQIVQRDRQLGLHVVPGQRDADARSARARSPAARPDESRRPMGA
jgi:hypothetical protein